MKKSKFAQLKAGDVVLIKSSWTKEQCIDDSGFPWADLPVSSCVKPGAELEFIEHYRPSQKDGDGVCWVKLVGSVRVDSGRPGFDNILPRKLIKRKVESSFDRELEIPVE